MKTVVLGATRRLCVAVGLAAAGLAPLATPGLAQTIDMKIGFGSINDSQHETAKLYAAEIEARTNGAIKARLFPAAQLGPASRNIEGLQLGTQEAFISPPGFFVGVNPAFQAPDAPGLFESCWHQHATLNHATVRERFLGLAKASGVAGVYIWCAGKTAIATREPVRRLADLNGMKIRVLASKTEVALMRALGATGVPMEFSETLAAIQNRTLDGARTGVIVLGPSRFYTAAKYLYNETASHIPSAFWVSEQWLARLSPAQREAVFAVGRDLTDRTAAIALELTERWEKLWVENGEVIEPTAADKAEIARRAQPIGDEVLGSDPRVKDMYALVKEAAAQTRGARAPR